MIVDLFCGGGGWAAGLHQLGFDEDLTVGVDADEAAARTHQAAGFPTIIADLSDGIDWTGWTAEGLIASPPCQDYSTAGNGTAGTADLTHIVPAAVKALRPDWVICEQVRAVLPIWQEHSQVYQRMGYRTWAGLLDASAYGVPQRRIRAVLIASRTATRVGPPNATHTDGAMFTAATVTAQQALDLDDGWAIDRRQNSRGPAGTVVPVALVPCDRPAPTVTGAAVGQWVLVRGNERQLLTVAQAARLQGFPDWWPWQGNKGQKGQQIGNAVPPPMAAALIGHVAQVKQEVAA